MISSLNTSEIPAFPVIEDSVTGSPSTFTTQALSASGAHPSLPAKFPYGHQFDAEPRLTIRQPGEILEMHFDDADLFVENGILAKGQSLTILGPGGVGKSRLIVQLAECTILGKPFLGWKVTSRPIRWLILQAENSNRRLKDDLENVRKRVSSEEWERIHANLLFHTIEQDHDGDLSVNNDTNKKRLSEAIKGAAADVVVFDPLYAFAAGNLNSDAGMIKTCQGLERIIKSSTPASALVIVHHALTGKAGIAKATGYDRSSYGRGSKALQFWTRAQINIAPGAADANGRLVISCGKNSNYPEFQPFGIRLNQVTLAYEPDPEFDLENWKAGISDNSGSASSKEALIAELVRSLPQSRKELTNAIMEEVGCGKSTAYELIKKAEGRTIRRNASKLFEAIEWPQRTNRTGNYGQALPRPV